MTADVVGSQDELILLDNGEDRRKLISEINLSQFNNDSNWTSNVGDITGVSISAGTGIGVTQSNTTSGDYSGTISLSHLGIENLSDPNGDRILIWDDSAGAVAWATAGNYLSISGTL